MFLSVHVIIYDSMKLLNNYKYLKKILKIYKNIDMMYIYIYKNL